MPPLAQALEQVPVEDEAGRGRLRRRPAARRSPSTRPRARAARRRARTGPAGRGGRCRRGSRRQRRRSAARSGAGGDDANDRRRRAARARGVSPTASGGGSGRSSVRMRQSPSPKTTARKHAMSSAASERRPARRTSIAAPLARWRPERLAGSVAASLATTRSPGTSRSASALRGWCAMRPARIDDEKARVARSLHRPVRGLHVVAPAAGRCAVRAARSARALAIDAIDDLARRVARPLQRRRVGVGHGGGMQRRVHVAGIDGDDGDAVRRELFVPDPAHVRERRLARAVGAPAGVGVHGGVARHVDDDRAAAFRSRLARRRGEQAEQRLGQAKRSEHVGRQGALDSPRTRCRRAVRAAPDRGSTRCGSARRGRRARRRPAARSAWTSSFLETSPTMPWLPWISRATRATRSPSRATKATWSPRAANALDEGEAEARRAAGDGDAKWRSRGRGVHHHGVRSEAMVRR